MISLSERSKRRPTAILPPVEFADAVEMYARRHDRNGALRFIPPPVNCWIVAFSLKPNDPRRLLGDDQEEIVYLWRQPTREERAKQNGPLNYVGYKLDELGVTGLVEFLEKTNTWSGRGQYDSLASAMRDQDEKKATAMQKAVDQGRQDAVDDGMQKRRQVLKIPFLPVGINLKKSRQGPTTAPKEKTGGHAD